MSKDMKAENAEKLKVLNSTLERLEKVYGKGAIMKLGDKPSEEIDVISSGSIGLDVAMGVNGLPKVGL
jgi:recombination protein RecA